MKKKFVAALIAAMMATTAVSGCGTQPTEPVNVTKTAETKTETPTVVNSEAAGKYILGIADRFVLEGAKNVDLLSRKTSIDKVITDVKVDDSAVDTTKPGTYKVKYTVTVDLENLERAEAYVAEHPEALEAPAVPAQTPDAGQEQTEEAEQPAADKDGSPGPAESAEPAAAESAEPAGAPAVSPAETPESENGGQAQGPSAEPVLPNIPAEVFDDSVPSVSGDPGKTAEVVIEKDVTVVTPEEAVEIIEGGGEVWTDESRPATVEELSGEEAPQTATTQPAGPAEPETGKDGAKETAADTDKEDRQESGSSGSGGQSSQSSSGSGKAHTHNWVERTETIHHDEQGHYETVQVGTETVVDEVAWDEPVYESVHICSACGYESSSGRDMGEHIADVHDFEASYGTVDRQVDTINHPAVTHEEPVYEDRWVVDSEAWSEEKVVGYYCSECGAEK